MSKKTVKRIDLNDRRAVLDARRDNSVGRRLMQQEQN
jgi:hypothetical protein